ncbi:hypothetical protein J7K43_03100 [Candidatus Calescamantes bacterium]|nr:hypothetical protein [Candidatus Calescamantes bacterium]
MGGIISIFTKEVGYPSSLIPSKLRIISSLLSRYLEIFGREELSLYRIPARVNLMGMHIEHRGGYVNHISLPYENFFLVSSGNKGEYKFFNLREEFPPRKFKVEKYLSSLRRDSWLGFIEKIEISQGDWGNYLLASILRLAKNYSLEKSPGLKGIIGGDVPIGSGLSSSSTLVVGIALAIIENNYLPLSREELVEICGEAEWFVGTRGGAGDHGAMLLGKKGKILHLRFFPLTYEYLDFPSNLSLIVAHSGKKAEKTKEAKDIFNERVATYILGLKLLRERFPEWRNKLKRIRDITPENLGVEEREIYRIIKFLPLRATREELKKELGEKETQPLFLSHREPPEGYRIREVLLYGISECRRAEVLQELAKNNNWKRIGELMYCGHDGDRVTLWKNDKNEPFLLTFTEDYLEEVYQENLPLEEVSGRYFCSTMELDLMVDTVKNLDPVIGARLTGAGLGGSIVILLEKGGEGEVKENLIKCYYDRLNISPSLLKGVPVEGAGEI